jgi:acetyl-CoA carboxylase biotin carboxyl carrier protein
MAERKVMAEITGRVWKIIAPPGSRVGEEDPILIIESIKMEVPVLAPVTGVVKSILVGEGEEVAEGQELAIVDA